MALNIKTLGTRALTALVFVSVLLGGLLWNYYSFTIFFFIVSMLGLNEFYKIADKLGAKPYRGIGFVSALIIYLLFVNTFLLGCGVFNFTFLIAILPFLIFAVALFSHRDHPVQNTFYTIGGIIYAVVPFALLNEVVSIVPGGFVAFNPRIILGTILLIWSNDTFAYLGGSLFGKHKMIERISPGKTWEGTFFGFAMTIVSGYIVGKYILQSELALWLILGAAVPVLATTGDLIESMLKRQAGIKDSGNLMPGHGGILDRFDSLIFVSPFLFVIVKLIA